MKRRIRIMVALFFMAWTFVGVAHAADDQVSLGARAGETARELKDQANESLSTGASKVGEASRKVEAGAQEAVKTVQEQWDEFAKQFREKTQQLRKQAEQQWQDFQRSFNASARS